MSGQVSWMLELTIKSGRAADFEALVAEMVAATRDQEPGTLDYEWNVSADGATCHLFERYADSDAVMVHLKTFGERYAARFLDLLAPTRLTVYGNPNETVRSGLAAMGPVYFGLAGGFSR